MSVTDAAKALGISRQQLHNVLAGRYGITPEMAVRLEKALGSTADTWLGMQINTIWRKFTPRDRRSKSRGWLRRERGCQSGLPKLGKRGKSRGGPHSSSPGLSGLVLAILYRGAPCDDLRDSRDKPGHPVGTAVTFAPVTKLGIKVFGPTGF